METAILPRLQPVARRALTLLPRPAVAALGAAAGVGLLFWAQTDFSQRHFGPWSLLLLAVGVACVVAAALNADYRPFIGPAGESAPARETASVLREWTTVRGFALLCVGIFTLMAYSLNDRNMFTARGVIVWFAAIFLFLAVWWQPSARAGPPLRQRLRGLVTFRRERALRLGLTLAVFLLVAGLAAFFRLYQLDTLPGNATGIEADIGADVREILSGRFWIYMPREIGEGGLLYLVAGAVKLFGVALDYNAIKVATALAGLVGVGATYLLLKEVFLDRSIAVVGCLLMAVAHWPVALSRTSFMPATAPFWAAITLLLLLRVLKHNRTNDYLLCGLGAGFGLYFYQGLRVVPFLIVACLLAKFLATLLSRRWRESFSVVRRSILLGLTLLIVFTPMARTWYDDPGYYMQGVQTRAVGSRPAGYVAPVRFAENLKKTFLMFNWEGDAGPLRNVAGAPALDEAMAALLIAGASIGVAVWLRQRRGLFPFAAIAFLAFLLPSALALAAPEEVPDFGRAGGVIPLVFGFVAIPVCLGLSSLRRSIPGRRGAIAAALLLGLLVAGLGVVNYRWYFDDYSGAYASTSAPSRSREVILTNGADGQSPQRLEQFFPQGRSEWWPGQQGTADAMLLYFTSP